MNTKTSRRVFVQVAETTLLVLTTNWTVGASSGDRPGNAANGSGARYTNRNNFFPLGVFEDGMILNGDVYQFEDMAKDLMARSLDSVLFTNNNVARDTPLLDISDRHGINVIFAPTWDLYQYWWPSNIPADYASARRAITPIVKQLKDHSSLRGYIVADEPDLTVLPKLLLGVNVFREIDPDRPATPILIGLDRGDLIFKVVQPSIMLIDVYPCGKDNPIGDFSMTGFGYPQLDFVDYVRAYTHLKPAGTPLWMILQTHRFTSGNRFALREPTPAEVRAQQWLAIGEGATGIFWFIYSSEQGWTGLKDNPTLFDVVSNLAQRLAPVRPLLLTLHPVDDHFQIDGTHSYVRTLANQDLSRFFVIAVNRDCNRAQPLRITPTIKSGQGNLHDLVSGRVTALGSPLIYPAGDGRIFEFESSNSEYGPYSRR